MRFGLFFLAEYLSIFAVSCLGTVLFLGGGLPIPFASFPADLVGGTRFSLLLVDGIVLVPVFMAKVLFFIFLIFWVRATLPRMRVDRLMNFAWKYLVPLSIVNIFVAAVWYELVMRAGSMSLGRWLLGTVVTGAILLVAIGVVLMVNRRSRAAEPLGTEWPSVGSVRPPVLTARAALRR
jgi:NADH-quinone oxidoreductase subunit H